MKVFEKYKLGFVVFTSGAAVMVFELIAPRLYAPFYGTSIFIWTNVIGVVMISLSLGYFLGGRIADKWPNKDSLFYALLSGGLAAYVVTITHDLVLLTTLDIFENEIFGSFVVSVLILFPLNFVLGMVAPITIRLEVRDKKHTGRTSGNIYALSTLGSITGTFLSGFWLIPNFGLNKILLAVSIILIGCALIVSSDKFLKRLSLFLIFIAFLVYSFLSPQKVFKNIYENYFYFKLIADFNSKYNRMWIYDRHSKSKDPQRYLSNSQSAIFLNKDPSNFMVFNYNKYFELSEYFFPSPKNVLLIGGGAYTYAYKMQVDHPDRSIDVVEIDPALWDIAIEYFKFRPNNQITNYPQDGRAYLNKNIKQYDVIFFDAFMNGSAMPFQLATKEAYTKAYHSLNSNGLVLINIISRINGPGSELFKSQYLTLKSVFPEVKFFSTENAPEYIQRNIVLIGFKSENIFERKDLYEQYEDRLVSEYKVTSLYQNVDVLTDDYAPVEYYDLQRIIN